MPLPWHRGGAQLGPHAIAARLASKQEASSTDRPLMCAKPKKLNGSTLPSHGLRRVRLPPGP
jgi:hypothetical protein